LSFSFFSPGFENDYIHASITSLAHVPKICTEFNAGAFSNPCRRHLADQPIQRGFVQLNVATDAETPIAAENGPSSNAAFYIR